MEISTNRDIKLFLNNVQQLNRLISLVGTSNDNEELRNKIEGIREQTKQLDIDISKKIGKKTLDQCNENDYTGVLESQYLQTKDPWKILYKESFLKEIKYPLQKSNSVETISINKENRSNTNHLPSQKKYHEEHTKLIEDPQKLVLLESQKQYSSKEEVLRDIVQSRNTEINQIKSEMIEVVDVFKMTSKLVKDQGHTIDHIETHTEETKDESHETLHNLAHTAKQQATIWPVSGAAIGGVLLGGIGSLLGPFGMAVGGTTGATLGGYLGTSVGQLQRDVVDKEVFERHLANKWVADDQISRCSSCDAEFTHYLRKHHCRACGNIFCANCSSKKLPFKLNHMDNPRMERVCNKCHSDHWNQ